MSCPGTGLAGRGVLAVGLAFTLFTGGAHCLIDEADGSFTGPTLHTNIEVASNTHEDGTALDVAAVFAGDDSRYSRASAGKGTLKYDVSSGITYAAITFWTFQGTAAIGTWQVNIELSTNDILTLKSADLSEALSSATGSQYVQSGSHYRVSIDTDGTDDWLRGTIEIDAESAANALQSCQDALRIEISGGDQANFWDFQIGSVEVTEAAPTADGLCAGNGSQGCLTRASGPCPEIPATELSTFVDQCSGDPQPYGFQNLQIRRDSSDSFNGDDSRYARADASQPGNLTYRFASGGVAEIRVALALRFPNKAVQLPLARLTVLPYLTPDCKPEPHVTDFQNLTLVPLAGGWEYVEIRFTVGPLPGLDCTLAAYVELSLAAPEGSDMQITRVLLVGQGTPTPALPLDGESNSSESVFSSMLFVWLAVGVAAVLLVVLGALIWCCCGRPGCGGSSSGDVHAPLSGKGGADGSMVNGKGGAVIASGSSRMQLPGQVMIPVDCVVSDMPPDEQSGGFRGVPTGDAAYTAASRVASAHGRAASANGRALAHGAHEPVIDLAVRTPTGISAHMAQNVYLPPVHLAPRSGQDIFDTWQQTGLSGYHSGEDMDASGPLDTRNHSFTGNPPISSTGNTSPTQESSVVGVTAQIGMRLNELKGLQSEHERIAKGQFDSNGEMHIAPEPLGVAYGKKIGVGGFGAVYEGQWAGKQVAVKVIKMPQNGGPGEERERMAFMEYAIAGLLVHDNIVQTYQADIRPVFLEDDDAGGKSVSKSSWTGLGEFLSNETISKEMHKSMRIQEWELRLVMEYCNRGNLKEAIRHGSLQKDSRAKALEVALLARDVARGCQAIHRYSIIHGDLKPHNVLLTVDTRDERGWVGKIADFGLSVKIKRGERHVSGIQHGTEGYVAPEVLQTRRMVPVSDVYSFGIIMWELWHSRLYYEEYRAAVRRMRRVTLEFRPTFERKCPEQWVDLATSCWSLRPEERPDFDRVVKMMNMIIASFRDKVNGDGVIAAAT